MNQKQTLYNGADSKVRAKSRPFLVFMAALLVLILFRFLNFFAIWQTTRMELRDISGVESGRYFFLGLSTQEKARKRLIEYSDTRVSPLTVVSYFTPLHPAVFLISNSGSKTFVELGRLAVLVLPGISRLRMLPQDVLEVQRQGSIQRSLFGSTLLPVLMPRPGKNVSQGPSSGDASPESVSYVCKEIESTRFIKIPFLAYFYLPALLIIALSFVYGKGFYMGFLFYFWMFFLFDFRDVLVEIPFSWLFEFLGSEPSGIVTLFGGIIIVLISIIMTILGFHHLKHLSRTFWSRALVLVFVFLPFFLRY